MSGAKKGIAMLKADGFHDVSIAEGLERVTTQRGRAFVMVDNAFCICDTVSAEAYNLQLGDSVYEALPMLVGSEAALEEMLKNEHEGPGLILRNISVDAFEAPSDYLNLLVEKVPGIPALLVSLEDASEEAALMQNIVQQHNELAFSKTQLEDARDRALAADRAKNAFLANISHELRTPLTVIIGNTEILQRAQDNPLPPEDYALYLKDIHDSGSFLLALINDLIDLSRAETAEIDLQEAWCDLPRLAREAVEMARRLPGANGKQLTIELPAELPLLWCDEIRIKQILINLLSNAVKFTGPDGVIRIHTATDSGCAEGLTICVSDNGPGMSEADLLTARARFGQLDSANRTKGTGLGLNIVESLASMHNAQIYYDTREGQGLRVRLQFPSGRLQDRN